MNGTIETGLAAAPLGKYDPGIRRIGFGLGRASHVVDRQVLYRNEVVLVHESATELVGRVAALVGDRAMTPSHDFDLASGEEHCRVASSPETRWASANLAFDRDPN